MPPIETTTGLPAALAAASSSRMISEAVTLPPGLFTRRTMALIFGSRRASRICAAVVSPPTLPGVSSPSMMAPLAKITAMAEPLVRRRLHVVVVIADRPVIVIRFAPAKLFGQRLFHFRGGRQLIHQLIVQRIFRRIAAHLTQAIDNAQGRPGRAAGR